jgi:hypothetical protein
MRAINWLILGHFAIVAIISVKENIVVGGCKTYESIAIADKRLTQITTVCY